MSDPTGDALRANAADLPFDSSDKASVKASIKSAKQVGLRRKAALQNIMQSAEGRMWMHNLLLKCGPFRTPFSTDPIAMAFNCGQQDIGLQLLGELHEASSELYLVMMRENANG